MKLDNDIVDDISAYVQQEIKKLEVHGQPKQNKKRSMLQENEVVKKFSLYLNKSFYRNLKKCKKFIKVKHEAYLKN
jgi:hypothetical protein